MKTTLLTLLLFATLVPTALPAQAPANTFTNPLLPSGPDPWVTSYKGTYYYMATTGHNLTLWATPDITDLAHAQKKVVWTPPADGPYSHEIWAPEIHRFDGKWYIYFAADALHNETHRIYVIENASEDPMQGDWTLKGKVGDRTDKWAIDASAFEVNGQKYLIWSGWKGDTDGEQDIFIAHLKNPWTVDSERTLLSHPQYPWEEVGDLLERPSMPHLNVNEGPEILIHNKDIFLVYSGSACWTDYYELGVLQAHLGDNLLDANSWHKFDHNGFFKSPDGKQDWIIYHANSAKGQGCGAQRSPRAQPFTWNPDGTPNFGTPIPTSTPIPKPSR
jgi:GH43 family beta-xylosidase